MRRPATTYLLLAVLGLIGTGSILLTTLGSVGLAPDSYAYVATARSLLTGHGLTIPVGPEGFVHSSHFPPLYAGLLSISSLGLTDPLLSGRWLNALIYGANIFLVGLSIYRLTEGSHPVTFLGALFVLGAESQLLIHSHLWSEPSFYFFSLVGLLLLTISVPQQNSRFRVAAAVAFALAALVRYAGLTLALTGALFLLIGTTWPWQIRLRRAGVFLAISAGPVLLWMLYNLLLTGSLTNRTLSYHPVNLKDLQRGLETISTWIIPTGPFDLPSEGRAVLGLFAILTLVFFVNRTVRTHRTEHPLWLPYLLFTVIYPIFLLVSISILDRQTSLDPRILSPIYFSGLILVMVLFAKQWPGLRSSVHLFTIFPVFLLAVASLAAGGIQAIRLVRGEGKGYGSPYWQESRLVEQAREYPAETPIYSNGHDVIYLLTGKPAIPLPQAFSPNTLRPNQNFTDQMKIMASDLRKWDGRLIYFELLQNRRHYLPREAEILNKVPLSRLSRWAGEGSLYRIEP